MKILERITNRPRAAADDPGSAEAGPAGEGRLPIGGYDRLDAKQLRAQLSGLSQVELAAIEDYELAHQARPAVLNRLRWLTGSEPMPGYDALDTEALVTALSGADAATLKAVRDYERRHLDRLEVRAEVERVLPTAPLSAQEDRAREEQDGLVQAGFAGREAQAGVARRRSAPGAAERNGLPFGRTHGETEVEE